MTGYESSPNYVKVRSGPVRSPALTTEEVEREESR